MDPLVITRTSSFSTPGEMNRMLNDAIRNAVSEMTGSDRSV